MFGFSPQWSIVPAAVVFVAAALFVSVESGAIGGDAATHTDPEIDAERQRMQAQLEASKARINYKNELVERLIAGQATLAEVSGEFLRMNQATSALEMIRHLHPGSSDEEKSAHNVIEFVRQRRLPAERKRRSHGPAATGVRAGLRALGRVRQLSDLARRPGPDRAAGTLVPQCPGEAVGIGSTRPPDKRRSTL